MQGRSLVPVLANPDAPGRNAWLYEYFPVFPLPIPGITAIRSVRYKYVEYQNDLRPRERFDRRVDPPEKNNLMGMSEGAAQADALKQELERLKKETGYRFHTRG